MASLAAPLIQGGLSLFGGLAGGKGAAKAAKIQAQAYQQGIQEQRNEFNTIQGNEEPYMQAGIGGLKGYGDLVGSNGTAAQQSAIDALKASPMYTSAYQTGLDTILQNAAATGGLRGGNTALAESNFGANLLSSLMQNQLGNYGNLVNWGQAGAAGTNAAATNTGNNISNLLGQEGSANATAAAAPYAAFSSALQGVGSAFGNYYQSNSLADLLKSLGGGIKF